MTKEEKLIAIGNEYGLTPKQIMQSVLWNNMIEPILEDFLGKIKQLEKEVTNDSDMETMHFNECLGAKLLGTGMDLLVIMSQGSKEDINKIVAAHIKSSLETRESLIQAHKEKQEK